MLTFDETPRRDRRTWVLAASLVVPLLIVAASSLFPVACAFTFHGFESIVDQERFIPQFEGLWAATFGTIRFDVSATL